jgi:hypothetical protein
LRKSKEIEYESIFYKFFLCSRRLVGVLSRGARAKRETAGRRHSGITGSRLVNGETGKTVWFSLHLGSELGDDLRLPMSPNLAQNRDTIVAKDILRKIELPASCAFFPTRTFMTGASRRSSQRATPKRRGKIRRR